MKLYKWIATGITILTLTILLVGCVSKSRYETLQEQNANLETELEEVKVNLASLEAELEEVKVNLASLQADKTALETAQVSLQASYNELEESQEAVTEELRAIKEIYPPGDFNSLTELELWVSNHTQPSTTYLDSAFRSALKVQSQGLEDGYLISVMYDEDDTDPDTGWIYCGALVNGHLYIWHPEFGEIHSWYADWLIR